jgi:hypothetical protein
MGTEMARDEADARMKARVLVGASDLPSQSDGAGWKVIQLAPGYIPP